MAETMNPQKIIEAIRLATGYSLKELKSKSRQKELTAARHILHYVLRVNLNMLYTQIGFITNRNHATIIHSYVTVKNLIEINDELIINLLLKIQHYEKKLETTPARVINRRARQIVSKIIRSKALHTRRSDLFHGARTLRCGQVARSLHYTAKTRLEQWKTNQ